MSALSEIEGIGEVYASKLNAIGVSSIEKLLEIGGTKKGRQTLAHDADISEKLLLNWVNRADLARIKGISTQYADLLEAAGVDSVPELAQRNAHNLMQMMADTNEAKNLVRKLPTESQVIDWVAQAKTLPRAVSH